MERDPRRGALFWWLYDSHAALLPRAKSRRINWSHLMDAIPAKDRLDAEGKPATTEVARKTWLRVRKLKQDEEAERKAQQRPPRVPTPKANTPPPASTMHSRPTGAEPRMQQGGPTHSRPAAAEPAPGAEDPKARAAREVAKLRKRFLQRS